MAGKVMGWRECAVGPVMEDEFGQRSVGRRAKRMTSFDL